jgi:capsular polysaccharide biosynthesis protein
MTAGPGDWTPTGRVGRGRPRVSHLDREHVVEVLKAAFVQGRLTKDEFDLRIGQALVSRTFMELATVTVDVPAGLSSARYPRSTAGARAQPLVRKVVTAGSHLVVPVAALGLLAGIAFALLIPPVFTSSSLVMLRLSPARYIGTQVAIAGSDPVLYGALQNVKPAMSLPALRSDVQVKILTSNIISIKARAATATQAARTADAVADSYVAYVDKVVTPGHARARIIESTVGTTEAALPARLLVSGGIGALIGALIGVIAALALSLSHRRPRIW